MPLWWCAEWSWADFNLCCCLNFWAYWYSFFNPFGLVFVITFVLFYFWTCILVSICIVINELPMFDVTAVIKTAMFENVYYIPPSESNFFFSPWFNFSLSIPVKSLKWIFRSANVRHQIFGYFLFIHIRFENEIQFFRNHSCSLSFSISKSWRMVMKNSELFTVKQFCLHKFQWILRYLNNRTCSPKYFTAKFKVVPGCNRSLSYCLS